MSNLVTTSTETDFAKALRLLGDRKPTSATTSTEVGTTPKPTVAIPVSEESQEALADLEANLGSVEFPATRRELTPAEVETYITLFKNVQAAESATKAARDAVRTSVYNHMDVTLEDDGGFRGHDDIDVDKDAKGFYVLAQRIGVPGNDYEFSREVKNPAPILPAEGIKQLWDEGQITRAQYYRMTRKPVVPREVDEAGVTDELVRDPALAAKLAKVLVRPAATTSLNLRKKAKS